MWALRAASGWAAGTGKSLSSGLRVDFISRDRQPASLYCSQLAQSGQQLWPCGLAASLSANLSRRQASSRTLIRQSHWRRAFLAKSTQDHASFQTDSRRWQIESGVLSRQPLAARRLQFIPEPADRELLFTRESAS